MSLLTPPSTRARTLGLAAAISVLALGSLAWVGTQPVDAGLPILPWWLLAGAFVVSESAVFHLEFREEAHSFTASDIPLVLGLFFATPGALVIGRLVGSTLVLLKTLRGSPLKLVFNVALFAGECAAALTVFHVVFGEPSLLDPGGWVAALAAVAVADALSAIAVATVIRWHSGTVRLMDVLLAGAGTAVANGSLAIVAALLTVEKRAALVLLGVLATMVYLAYRGYAGLSQRYGSLNLLYDFTDALGSIEDSQEVVGTIMEHARELMRAEHCEILVLPDGSDGVVRMRAGRDEAARHGPVDEPLALFLQQTVALGHSVLSPRGTDNPVSSRLLDLMDVRDCILVPLEVDGRVFGGISVGSRLADISTFDEEDRRLLEALANHASIALDNSRLISELQAEVSRREHQALVDQLTGLPNRHGFFESCERAIEQRHGGRLVGVLLMDVDQFKDVNDTLGHETGDEILQELGHRLSECAPDGATVARLGGDEFAVLLTDGRDQDDLMAQARSLRAALGEPIEVKDLKLAVEVSTGVVACPTHGDDAVSLLQRADIAMYRAKAQKTGLEIYAAEYAPNAARRLWVATALRQTIAEGGLEVHFQPKAGLRDGRIVGAEALVRWTDPQRGPISPAEFVPIAERTELITPLTEFVLRESVAQCRLWHATGHPLSVSVNIAARSLLDPGLFDLVTGLMTASGLPFDRLTLEITETGVMMDMARSIDALDRFAETGIKLSVDDFGTGHSSLSYLQRLPVHEVKIDRAFVFNAGTDDSDAAIVRSIINLGHTLGLDVVAEGVENQLTIDRLSEMGCDIAQGYYLSRPIPARQFESWIEQRGAADRLAPPPATIARLHTEFS